ncbi:MAG TPA: CoA pyrophosphatase [Geobacteraceae bacterium]|nr:CoA pyrophosphatase [Geobacteraceae bacterium]
MTFDHIIQMLARHHPTLFDLPTNTRAAVALVLRAGAHGLKALFIERAPRTGDPWSGDIGFPGGKMEAGDSGMRQTAERETREEIGLDLRGGRYLGRLSDIAGAHLPVLVSCHVYGVEELPLFVLNHEVRDLFWVSLADLNAPEHRIIATVRFGDEMLDRPAIRLPQPGKPVLWGITFRIVMEFLELFREERSG